MPQLLGSACRLISQPLAGLLSQFSKPMLHALMVHLPPRHWLLALANWPHTMPQPPQFWSELMSVSQPVIGSLSQSEKPGLHAPTPHTPSLHEISALAGAGHLMPQPLQLSTSLLVLASQPVLGSMSQSVKPGLHAETTQAPLAHSMIAFCAAHTLPQTPQLRASALVAFSQPFLTSRSQSP